jgi:hypothetical protein
MQLMTIKTLALAAMVSGAAYSAPAGLVPVETERLFVPAGFDDNDNVEVILDGYLPSGCYKLTRPEVSVNPATRRITVTPMARYFEVPCIEALVPYTYEVQLGALPAGDFEIVSNGGNLTQKMHVDEARNAGPDDYLYAPVDTVHVAKREGGVRHSVAIIEGRFTNNCMQFKEVNVITSGATIQVLPVIEMADRPDCEDVEAPFRRLVDLPEDLTAGRHLLHVRSLNGQAVNLVFSVESK